MSLDITSLKKAVDALERSLRVADENATSEDENLLETLQAGVIQNFEVAYEQSWKFIQRWLKENQSPDEADYPRTRKELFRMAARYKLVNDPEPWFSYGDARNLTSHTYDVSQATQIFACAKLFFADAKALVEKLETLND